jgi:hypothetical protein
MSHVTYFMFSFHKMVQFPDFKSKKKNSQQKFHPQKGQKKNEGKKNVEDRKKNIFKFVAFQHMLLQLEYHILPTYNEYDLCHAFRRARNCCCSDRK